MNRVKPAEHPARLMRRNACAVVTHRSRLLARTERHRRKRHRAHKFLERVSWLYSIGKSSFGSRALGNMSAEHVPEFFFQNDIVYRFDKRRRVVFGIVQESYECSDPAHELVDLKKGQVIVCWFTRLQCGSPRVVNQNKLRLLSRNIGTGDIVRRLVNGVETQRGYCRRTKRYSVLKILGLDMLIDNVPHERLDFERDFEIGIPACYENQIGRLWSCDYNIELRGVDESVIIYKPDFFANVGQLTFSEFHTGGVVSINPSDVSNITWVKKSRKQNANRASRFVVHEVTPVNVRMSTIGKNPPVFLVPNEHMHSIKTLRTMDEINMRVHDRRRVDLLPTDKVYREKVWLQKQTERLRPKKSCKVPKNTKSTRRKTLHSNNNSSVMRRGRRGVLHQKTEEETDPEWVTVDEEDLMPPPRKSTQTETNPKPLVVGFCTDATADIVWQDGTIENDVPTTQLYFSMSLDDHEFFPGEWVVGSDGSTKIFGVVQKMEYMERTAQVQWFSSKTDPSPLKLEELSVYEIKKHEVYVFRPGSVVFRIVTCPNSIGTVIDSLTSGFVRVKWIDDTVEDVWPHTLGILPDMAQMVDMINGYEPDHSETAASWETQSCESIMGEVVSDGTLLTGRLTYIRARLTYMWEFLTKDGTDVASPILSFSFLRSLLLIYENFFYLDKLLGTQHFSIHDEHYQDLIQKIKQSAAMAGVQFQHVSGQLTRTDSISDLINLQSHLTQDLVTDSQEAPSNLTSEQERHLLVQIKGLAKQLVSMIKCRMDLCFAETLQFVEHQNPTFDIVETEEVNAIVTPSCTSTPIRSAPTTSDDSLTSITTTPPKSDKSQSHNSCMSPELVRALKPRFECTFESFEVVDETPAFHRYFETTTKPSNAQRFHRAVMRESKLLADSLPPGIWVCGFADRADLYSVLIRGSANTPYEDGLFMFDVQLTNDYPVTPPACTFVSYHSERLNPNLYVEGRICISLLGTWWGSGTETWTSDSTLLQVILSIQALILNAEPYYNEANYDKQTHSQQGSENSRTYNELVLLRLVQSMTEMITNPPIVFYDLVRKHFHHNGPKMVRRLEGWIEGTYEEPPQFSLLPVSKGLQISMRLFLEKFQLALKKYCNKA